MRPKLARKIPPDIQCELWGRAAARCQFSNCNKPLYKSPVTQERVNLAEKAHIYSFSEAGPRGRGPLEPTSEAVNGIANLMLVCPGCHKKIDRDKKGFRYSAKLLQSWKEEHERRIRIVTGIDASKKSHVVLYGSRIGDELSPLQYDSCVEAMFPNWYPAEEAPVNLAMKCSHDDSTPEFWTSEETHLRKIFDRQIQSRIDEAETMHFSVFALASQPLLILLGSLFTDKVDAAVYQPHREPKPWQWQAHPKGFRFKVVEPTTTKGDPTLVISLSAKIHHDRVQAIVGDRHSIWELTIDDCHNDFLQSEAQLRRFREEARKLMGRIEAAHPRANQWNIFPAMPAACAVELGRIRMPKAALPWAIYDQNNKHRRFIPSLTIGRKQ